MFPLPLDFFPPLRLSKQEAQSFLQWGDSLLQQTIDAYHREQFDTQETREHKWKPIKQRHNLTVYRRRKIKDESEFRYLCTGHIEGTLDEVVMGRYADNTPDFRRISGVYRKDIVDCAVLGVIQKRSADDPFFLSCFKWMTVESPGKGLVKNRDVCWYEQIGMTRDRNGKEIGYTLTESVELPTCPLFQECVRAKLSICYLYKRNKSGGINVYMRGKNNAGGKVVDWVADIKSAELWLRIEQAMPVAHAVIATALVEAGEHLMRPLGIHGKCEVCRAKVSGFFNSSKECAVCHRCTCSSCVTKVRVLSFHDFRIPHYERFCKKCIRLIHQVDLRSPKSVRNLVEYAAASLTEAEGVELNERTSNRKKAIIDASGHVEEIEDQHVESLTRSRGSSSGSIRALPQPLIRDDRDNDAADCAQSDGGKQYRPLTDEKGEVRSISRAAAVPVILYVDHNSKNTRRSLDSDTERRTAGSRRHSICSRTSLDEIDNKGCELVSRKAVAVERVNAASSWPSRCCFNNRQPSGLMTDSLMTRTIQLNLMAEQCRQQLQENIKLARQLQIDRM